MKQRGEINLHLILTIFLGLGMVLFGVLAILAYQDSQNIHTTLDQRVSLASATAADKQKKQDDIANTKANQLPYRTFVADAVNGGFELQIPRSWSMYAGQNTGAATQLNFVAEPDVVKLNLAPSAINTNVFKVQLLNKQVLEVERTFSDRLKKKKVTYRTITVSGIKSSQYDGSIDDQRHVGTVVIVPVRDKTLVFTTETNTTYIDEFNKIIASAKINP